MAKINTCIGIEEVTKMKFRKLGIELGPFVDRVLGNLLTMYEKGDINIMEVRDRLDKIKIEKMKLMEEEAELMATILQYEEKLKAAQTEASRRIDREMDAVKASGLLRDIPI
jgi:hypothetical protein